MTQQELADSIQVSGAYIHQLETGKCPPPGKPRCRQLAWVLKTNFDELWLRACASRAIRSMGAESAHGEGFRRLELLEQGERELLEFLRELDIYTSLQLLEYMSRLVDEQAGSEARKLFRAYLEVASSD